MVMWSNGLTRVPIWGVGGGISKRGYKQSVDKLVSYMLSKDLKFKASMVVFSHMTHRR